MPAVFSGRSVSERFRCSEWAPQSLYEDPFFWSADDYCDYFGDEGCWPPWAKDVGESEAEREELTARILAGAAVQAAAEEAYEAKAAVWQAEAASEPTFDWCLAAEVLAGARAAAASAAKSIVELMKELHAHPTRLRHSWPWGIQGQTGRCCRCLRHSPRSRFRPSIPPGSGLWTGPSLSRQNVWWLMPRPERTP